MADLPKIDEQPINLEQESVDRLGKAIFENATFHLEDAVKTVIPSIPKMIDELTAQIEDGSIKDVGKAFSKLEKIVEDLRIDLGRYNKELAEAVAQRAEMERQSQDKVDKLREQGVIARVDKDSKQVEILTKEKIREEKSAYNERQKEIIKLEKEIQDNRKTLQERYFADDTARQKAKEKLDKQIMELDEKKIIQRKKAEELNLGGGDTNALAPQTPMFFEMIKEGFMAPFVAIKDAFLQVKDAVKNTVDVFQYFGRGIGKVFGKLGDAFKGITKVFTVARLLIMAKVLAVVAVIGLIVKNFTKIKDFLGNMWESLKETWNNAIQSVKDFFKNMINGAIRFVNKFLPKAFEIPEMGAAEEEKKRQTAEQMETEKAQGEMAAAVPQSELTDYTDDSSKIMAQRSVDEGGLAKDNILYDQVASGGNLGIKSQIDTTGSLFANKRAVGDASLAENFAKVERERQLTKPPSSIVVQNNSNLSTASGTTVAGMINNRPERTFEALNDATYG